MAAVTKAFGYVRVSARGQIEGDGFRRQEAVIRAYAKANGYEVAQVFREEGVSGTTSEADRPAFQDMVATILRNGVRTIIVEGLDRLAREYRIQELLLTYLIAKGVTLISARTRENVTEAFHEDPMRRAMVQVQATFSELEKNLLVKKLKQARDRKRELEGRCGGRVAFTPDTLPEAIRTALVEVKLLRKVNPGQRKPSFAEVAQTLNAKGLQTVQGKPFTAANLMRMWRMHRTLV